MTSTPWAQQALDFSAVWDLTQGRGVTVAVVDSGVDAVPQLRGRVKAIDLTGTGLQDCVGHGTEVASIIAASDMSGVPFTGVAPQARILSVKYADQEQQNSPALLAKGIKDAAKLGASVINVSSTVNVSTPALRSAVDYALSRNAVVVAAGGNDGTSTGTGPFYPASYPGVLSVGAVESNGALAPFSDQRSHIAVTAPGVSITAAAPDGYVTGQDGTSYATAFVSGVAALVRSHYPKLTRAQVVSTIIRSADGDAGLGTGGGLVNPMQAVTTVLSAILSTGGASPSASPGPVAVDRAPVPDRADRAVALAITAGALGAAVLAVLGAVVIIHGRRRRWRPGPARLTRRSLTPFHARPWPGASRTRMPRTRS